MKIHTAQYKMGISTFAIAIDSNQMASSLLSASIHHHRRRHHRHHRPCLQPAKISTTPFNHSLLQTYSTTHTLSTSLLFQDSSFPPSNFNPNSRWCGPCPATSPRPPSPPSDEDQFSSSGLAAKLSRLQDRVQIFFAVLFWMSLFFWSCVWDSSNNNDKPPPFR